MTRAAVLVVVAVVLRPGAAVPAEVIGRTTPPESVTAERIAALPPSERQVFAAYLDRSRDRFAADRVALAAERRSLAAIPAPPPQGRGIRASLSREASWFAGPEARGIADNIVSFQTPAGGWGKNQDRTGPPRAAGQHFVIVERLAPSAPGAGPIWARFYDITTMRPVFGDRDRTIHDDVNEVSLERRNGYSWYSDAPAAAIRQYAEWAAAHPKG